MVFCGTKNEGTRLRTVSSMLAAGCAPSSVAPITSIGEAESVTERSVRRVPITTSSAVVSGSAGDTASLSSGSLAVVSWPHACAGARASSAAPPASRARLRLELYFIMGSSRERYEQAASEQGTRHCAP